LSIYNPRPGFKKRGNAKCGKVSRQNITKRCREINYKIAHDNPYADLAKIAHKSFNFSSSQKLE